MFRPTDAGPRRNAWLVHFTVGAATAAFVLYICVFIGHGWVRSDFYAEAYSPYAQLFQGHLALFIQRGPQYVGSLILRAPFALVAHFLGGSPRAVLYATALPCLLAVQALGAWLSVRTDLDRAPGRRISPIVLFALNPVAIVALLLGHPEDILGAALCVASVELALVGQASWAGVLLGLAVVNKFWAVVAIVVVIGALPARRGRAIAIAALVAAAVLGPVLVIQHAAGAAGAAASLGSPVSTSSAFTGQLLWWFGSRSWVVAHGRYLLVVLAAASAVGWWMVRRPSAVQPARRSEVLLLLALAFLLRAALDPEDNLYYHVPFILAIMAYELRRPARLTTFFSIALVLVVPPALLPVSPPVHALLYAVVTVPTLLWLIWRTLSGGRIPVALPSRTRSSGSAWGRFSEGPAELR